jgi:8-oxo-dGTP diphosphatase
VTSLTTTYASTPSIVPEAIHVVAAAILNSAGETLLARRPDHVHQGGLWEFPGGKVEPGETPEQALARELHEELGIVPVSCRPLIRVPYRYPDKAVRLDAWRVEAFRGTPEGQQGQPLAWVSPETLPRWPMPAANGPICTAVRLPPEYLITPEPADPQKFLRSLERSLRKGIRLVQLRAKELGSAEFAALARDALALCREHGAALLLNADPEGVVKVRADGVHLSAARLGALHERPLPEELWVGASCHGPDDLERAARLRVDFAVLSPVLKTASHPERVPLGWANFAKWVEACPFPVYALGGVARSHLQAAWRCDAQGIAGIRGLWNGA